MLHRIPLLGWLFKRDTHGRQPGAADLHHPAHHEGLDTNDSRINVERCQRKAVWGRRSRACGRLAAALTLTCSARCGELTRQGTALVLLIVTARGGVRRQPGSSAPRCSRTSSRWSTTCRRSSSTGRVTLRLALKDPGATSATAPSPTNLITIKRYRVRFIRADGRNTPGVDVPYALRRRDHRHRDAAIDDGLRTRPAHREDGSAAGGAREQRRDHLDHRRDHVLRTRPDGARSLGDRTNHGSLRQL